MKLLATINNKGVALLLTFIVMVTLLAITMAFLHMAAVQLKSKAGDAPSLKAFWLAEAGLQHYIYLLKTSLYYRKEFPDLDSQDLGDGTYSVDVERDGYTYKLISSGTVGGLTRRIQQSVDVLDPFIFAMHSFGSHTFFANSSGWIIGNVGARRQIQDTDGITIENGKFVENSEIQEPIVNYDGYRVDADYVITGNYEFTSGTYGSVGDEKIWYVEGNVTINSHTIIYGTIISEGNISADNTTGIIIAPGSDYPALVSRGNINAKRLDSSTIDGVMYAGNNLDFDNIDGVTVNGVMLSGKNTFMRQGRNFTINYDLENPPPYFIFDVEIELQKDWVET